MADELDKDTGLAPIPRHVDGDDLRPSGPQYWRQMLPVHIPNVGRAYKVVVEEEGACAELLAGGTTCWTLPFDRFKYLPSSGAPENLVKSLPPSDSLAESSPRPSISPGIAQRFAPAGKVTQIEVGHSLACARFDGGEVQCFAMKSPQRAASASDFPAAPTAVTGLSARALSVGGAACAITSGDEVVCWGFIAQTAMFPSCDVSE